MQNYNSKFKTDLKQRCFILSAKLIEVADNLPQQASGWVLGNQILRSGTSIGANLTEAKASSSRVEFKKFHEIALKSANETKYWLELLKETKKINKNDADAMLKELDEISRMIASGILKLKGKKTF